MRRGEYLEVHPIYNGQEKPEFSTKHRSILRQQPELSPSNQLTFKFKEKEKAHGTQLCLFR